MKQARARGGRRKFGRMADKCAAYQFMNRREKNKIRKLRKLIANGHESNLQLSRCIRKLNKAIA